MTSINNIKTGISQKVLDEIQSFAVKYEVDYVLLFGSRARGDYHPRSDIDLAFFGGHASSFIHDINEETSTLLLFDLVDLKKPVQDEETWLDALTARNNVTDSYNEAIALDIISGTRDRYYKMFQDLKTTIDKEWL